MRYMRGMAALVLATLTATPVLGAQDTTAAPRARGDARRVDRDAVRAYAWSSNRGRIGVVVNTKADAATDRLGARIEAVTPEGPADRAGLAAGDIITRLNGTSLAGLRAEGAAESGPGHKLVELARALEPGDTVRLEYRRGDATRTATLVAADLGFSWSGTMPRIEVMPPEIADWMVPKGPGSEFQLIGPGGGHPWHGVELVSLDRELGEYFGVTEGVLVVKAGGDSASPLRGGDVILAIDGRKPTTPSQAFRILRSYDSGETVTIDVQRKQRRQTISWTVPDTRMRMRSPRVRVAPRPERSEES